MRQNKFRVWHDGRMDYDYRDTSLFHGLLVCEGDAIPMQFTGLLDKNSKEIWEGDIVMQCLDSDKSNYGYGVIIFQNGAFGIADKPEQNSTPYVMLKHEYRKMLEVLGNIYEHPELLK